MVAMGSPFPPSRFEARSGDPLVCQLLLEVYVVGKSWSLNCSVGTLFVKFLVVRGPGGGLGHEGVEGAFEGGVTPEQGRHSYGKSLFGPMVGRQGRAIAVENGFFFRAFCRDRDCSDD